LEFDFCGNREVRDSEYRLPLLMASLVIVKMYSGAEADRNEAVVR
jgi:hypothetical protein